MPDSINLHVPARVDDATTEQQYRAALRVAREALNPEDGSTLMAMLGLTNPDTITKEPA